VHGLTTRQQEILGFIRDFIQAEGFPPTRAEISRALGFRSLNAAEDHLKALVRKGVIRVQQGTSRGIRVVEEDEMGLPVIGRVAAGSPILAESHIERRYKLTSGLFSPPADYLLKVVGSSMRDVGILEGDLLAVRKFNTAENGQIVVIRLENEVTVKRFKRRGNIVRLISENPDFEPIVVDLKRQSLEIEGIVVGVIRNGNL